MRDLVMVFRYFSILEFCGGVGMDVLGKRCVVKSVQAVEWVGVVVSRRDRNVVLVDAQRAGGQVGDDGFPAPVNPLPGTQVYLVDVVSVVPVENVES